MVKNNCLYLLNKDKINELIPESSGVFLFEITGLKNYEHQDLSWFRFHMNLKTCIAYKIDLPEEYFMFDKYIGDIF